MTRLFTIETPEDFDFRRTVLSHGWSSLLPFKLDRENWILETVVKVEKPISIAVCEAKNKLKIKSSNSILSKREKLKIAEIIRHIFRLDDDLSEFYELTKTEKQLTWIFREKAGRLLRSPTVFEDLIKTICTTNCSWALTKIMTENLVEKLGDTADDGRKSFPTPEIVASKSEGFYRTEIRAGYRAPYFPEIARKICEGKLDVESWLHSDLPTAELKKEIKIVKGVGDYAAENLLKLLGRYDGLALDSWLRGNFYKKHNGGNTCEDKQIKAHYEKYGKWSGLVIWCDMTEKWL